MRAPKATCLSYKQVRLFSISNDIIYYMVIISSECKFIQKLCVSNT